MAALDPINGVLGRKNAAHLLRRAAFGYTRKMIDEFSVMTISQAFDRLYNPVTLPVDSELDWLLLNQEDISEDLQIQKFNCWLLERMHKDAGLGIEKLIFFLHTHFTTIEGVVGKHAALYFQNKLFRYYCLGSIKALAHKMCIDNAMLLLLDGNLNLKNSPNENFAREFFELYTIGKGPVVSAGDYTNFTEDDIKAAARIFSGYGFDDSYTTIDADTGIPVGKIKTSTGLQSDTDIANRHDAGIKTFSPRFDGQSIEPLEKIDNSATVSATRLELEELIEMVFNKKETARHICRKIYRFFVYYKISPEIESTIIEPLADTLYNGNYELKPVLEQLIKSNHFFDADNSVATDDARGAIIKSPLEVILGTLIYFDVQPNPLPHPDPENSVFSPYQYLLESLTEQGMHFYEPLDVSGYDAYSQGPFYNRNWISANYLAYRYKFPQYLLEALQDNTYYGFYVDILSYVEKPGSFTDPSDATLLVQELIDDLLPETITPVRFEYFKSIFLDEFGDVQWKMEWSKYLTTQSDVIVRKQLEVLFFTILKSPEYQLN